MYNRHADSLIHCATGTGREIFGLYCKQFDAGYSHGDDQFSSVRDSQTICSLIYPINLEKSQLRPTFTEGFLLNLSRLPSA